MGGGKATELERAQATEIFYSVFPQGSAIKESAYNAGDTTGAAVLISGLGKSPGEGNGYLLQYSCLENPMGRGAWWATVHMVAKESDTTQQPNHNNKNAKGLHDSSKGIKQQLYTQLQPNT